MQLACRTYEYDQEALLKSYYSISYTIFRITLLPIIRARFFVAKAEGADVVATHLPTEPHTHFLPSAMVAFLFDSLAYSHWPPILMRPLFLALHSEYTSSTTYGCVFLGLANAGPA